MKQKTISLKHNGRHYTNCNVEELLEAGVPQEAIDAELATLTKAHERHQLRRTIATQVGDAESLLGTVSDASGILVAMAFADIVALSTNTSFADYKKAKLDVYKTLAGGADIATLAGQALASIQSGEVKLTASLKGLENVIAEVLARSTGVATIIEQATQPKA